MPNIQQKTLKSHIILFNAEHFSDPEPILFSSQYWQSKNALTGQAMGRGTTYFFQHNQHHYVLRHYCRGGLIGKILTDQYLYTGLEQSRAWQEFKLLEHMQSLGLACPTPIAAMLSKKRGYYHADLISTKIANAQDLSQILFKETLAGDIWQKIGQTIAQFHNNQIYHHDLNIHNIMLDAEHKAWLIDFDRCEVRQDNSWKQSNIARLKRSFEKEKRRHNILWQQADWQILISAYHDVLTN